MSSVAVIKLTSPTGTIEFSAGSGMEPPLVGRRRDATRIGMEQGSSMQKISVELSGFMEGNKNAEVIEKLESLTEILNCNQVTLYYHDGIREVVNKLCWISSGNQPVEWREYVGNYTISLYYFEEPNHGAFDVSWSSDVAYQFSPPPAIARAYSPNRKSQRAPRLSYNGVDLGNEVQVTLEGQLSAETPELLEQKRLALLEAFSSDGILNWGGFYSQAMRVGKINMPSVFPAVWMTYSIDLMYDWSSITEFSASRSFTGVHKNILIRENLMCPVLPDVIERNTSGQYVTYSIKASGYSIPTIRSFLYNEAQLIVYPNGYRTDRGEETWNEHGSDPSVSCSFTYFYPTPVIANIESIF